MPGQLPAAHVDAYWAAVKDELVQTRGAAPAEADTAIAAYRTRVARAGQAVYHVDPAATARTIVAHGLAPSLPAVGAGLALTLTLTDPAKVLADPTPVAFAVAGLIDAMSEYERTLGGAGLIVEGTDAYPGFVVVRLKPNEAMGAVDRLRRVAEAVEDAAAHGSSPHARIRREVTRPISDVGRKVVAVYVDAA